ncbi:C45 family autoproteolytic acyltransferase/hydrolase [Candidatus Latescibacterota bacterium]
MLRIETRGTPAERGEQQGRLARPLALPWMVRTLDGLCRSLGVGSPEELVRRHRGDLDRWRRQTEAVFPEGVVEYAGLARGLGVEEEAYLAVAFHHRLSGSLPQCTVVGATDADGEPVFGKTDDIEAPNLGMNLLEVTRPECGLKHLHLHFAGTPWSVAGINEAGFAMGMTGIPGPTKEEPGVFSLLALHTILPACASVGEAVDHLSSLQVNAYGFSLMVADAAGDLALIEKSGAGMAVMRPAEPPHLAHTNHILDPALAAACPEQVEPLRTNGIRRLRRATELLAAEREIGEILRDRSDLGAICQRGEDGLHTDFAICFHPSRRTATLWPGYPDATPGEELRVPAMLA